MGVIITPKVDTIFMIHCKSPRTHFRGERAIELPHFTSIGIESKEKKGGFILSKGEVDRILLSCLSRASIGSPTNSFFHRDTEITEGKRDIVVEC